MVLKEVRPGLYERTDTPKDVKVTREFAEKVLGSGNGHSAELRVILERAIQEGGEAVTEKPA